MVSFVLSQALFKPLLHEGYICIAFQSFGFFNTSGEALGLSGPWYRTTLRLNYLGLEVFNLLLLEPDLFLQPSLPLLELLYKPVHVVIYLTQSVLNVIYHLDLALKLWASSGRARAAATRSPCIERRCRVSRLVQHEAILASLMRVMVLELFESTCVVFLEFFVAIV